MSDDKKEYTSLDEKLKAEGWKVERILPKQEYQLSESLCKVALNMVIGKYADFMIIPADVARKGERMVFANPEYILYVKRTDAYQKELDSSPKIIVTIFKDVETDNPYPELINIS